MVERSAYIITKKGLFDNDDAFCLRLLPVSPGRIGDKKQGGGKAALAAQSLQKLKRGRYRCRINDDRRRGGEVVITHHGRRATVLRGGAGWSTDATVQPIRS